MCALSGILIHLLLVRKGGDSDGEDKSFNSHTNLKTVKVTLKLMKETKVSMEGMEDIKILIPQGKLTLETLGSPVSTLQFFQENCTTKITSALLKRALVVILRTFLVRQ